MSERIVAQAVLAATLICPRILHAAALAGHADPGERLRHLRAAQGHARELLTRLEIAELELAAAPRQPEENAA